MLTESGTDHHTGKLALQAIRHRDELVCYERTDFGYLAESLKKTQNIFIFFLLLHQSFTETHILKGLGGCCKKTSVNSYLSVRILHAHKDRQTNKQVITYRGGTPLPCHALADTSGDGLCHIGYKHTDVIP